MPGGGALTNDACVSAQRLCRNGQGLTAPFVWPAHCPANGVGDNGAVRARVRRFVAVAALAVAVVVGGAPAPAHAQVAPPALPVLPPVPSQLNPLLDLLAPVGSPTCGSASLLALTASALLPASLGASSLLGFGLAPVFIVCGNVPVPDGSTQLVCAVDDQVLAALSTVTLATIGSGPPVSTRLVGPVVETFYVLQANAPAAVGGLGGAGLLSGALACRALRAPSPPPPPASAPAVSDDDAPEVSGDEFLLPYLGSDFAIGSSGDEGVTSLLPGARVAPAVAVEGAHPFAYPLVFVLPLLLLAVGGYLARGLTDDIRFPSS